MPAIENFLALSVLAPLRPQLALDLFKAIRERGCEVEDCRLAPIGDRLAASLIVSGNWSALGKLETALPGLAQKLELLVQFTRCGARPQNPDFRAYAVDVVAPQKENLLLKLIEFFHKQGVEIAEIVTQKYESSYTGAGMCSVQMVLHVPVNQHPQALREQFMDLCDDINADGMLDPIKT